MGKSKIEWTDKTWNPMTGCTKVSEGCRNCYAERMSKRLAGRAGYPEKNPFAVTFRANKLDEPLRWRKPSKIFVCSMGDLFHEKVSFAVIDRMMDTMFKCPQHIFLLLTKRVERMAAYFEHLSHSDEEMGEKPWREEPNPNIWLGATVENQKAIDDRAGELINIPAARRFLSIEPAVGPIEIEGWLTMCDLKTKLIHWVIMGGETGPNARKLNPDWVRSVRDQCQRYSVPFFFKHWGTCAGDNAGCLLDGKEHKEVPR